MDDELEIDLRKIIRNLLKRWTYIVGLALLAGLVAFLFTFLQPRRYEASAVIALIRPPDVPNFDPRYQTTNPMTINNRIVIDVALFDEVLRLLFDQWNDPNKKPTDLPAFVRNNLKVEAGQDTTIAKLKVRLKKDPKEATRLARLWAEEVVQRINSTYSGRDEDQIFFFQEQVTTAEQRVQAAARALEEFEAQNQRASLQNQLNSLSAQQAEYLRRLRVIEAIQADGKVFLDQLRALPKDSPLSAQEQTNLFLLQMRIYGDTIAGIASASQVQLSLPELSSETTVGQYQQALTTWLAALQTQKSELEAVLQTLPPQIEQLQGQIAALDTERSRLDLEYGLARETLTTLRRKLDEAQIAVEDNTGYASIIAYPVVPLNPLPRGTLRNTALATVLGGFLAVFGVLVWDWWRSEEEEPAPAREETLAGEPVMAARR